MNMSDAWRLTAPKPEAIPLPLERAMHAGIFEWSQRAAGKWPSLKGLFHVPNGERRSPVTASLLKRLGQRNGVPDFLLPALHAGYVGLAMEVKRKPNVVTDEQQWWLDFLAAARWKTVVAWSIDEGIEALQQYVSASPTLIVPHYAVDVPF